MIRHGVVITTPHYITKSGPRSKVMPELVPLWARFDMREALQNQLDLPTLVLNDAEVAGAGVVTGQGLEMIVTLGTGLGNAIFDNGRLAPHVEVSQGPIRWGLTYDATSASMSACAWAIRTGHAACAWWLMRCDQCTCGTAFTSVAATRDGSQLLTWLRSARTSWWSPTRRA